MKTYALLTAIAALVILPCITARAEIISVSLTTDELGIDGFAGTAYNKEKVADVDVLGEIVMQATVGEGNLLTVQKSGDAGPGTPADPLLVSITAYGHLDTPTGDIPTLPSDWYAGGIYLSEDKDTGLNKLKDEGLGVRAVVVKKIVTGPGDDDWALVRDLDTETGRVQFDGSKDVSGGTDQDIGDFDAKHDPLDPDADDLNKAPHVDEKVCFNFNTDDVTVSAEKMVVVLTKFDDDDVINLDIELLSGETISLTYQGIPDAIIQEIDADDKVWKVVFDEIAEIDEGDILKSFCIRAMDPADIGNPHTPLPDPKGTAEHFLIHGLYTETIDPPEKIVPEPATMAMLAAGGCLALLRRKRRRS